MNVILRSAAVITLICFMPWTWTNAAQSPVQFDRTDFYTALAGSNANDIDELLIVLKESSLPEKEAYEGALLMKKAGLLSKAKEKLRVFKSGREKLEAAIQKEPKNVEYHFLRLLIQENVPKVVKYKTNIKNDSTLIRSSFKDLPLFLQKAIRDYSKKSKILNPSDF